MDGELTPEQEKQVDFIRKAAEDLSELVNDLLDLAKVEAGKVVVRPAEFEVRNLFGALRGMLRPLLVAIRPVTLVFDEPDGLPPLYTDEGKVSQILRNFISNALKFTEQGEVRVRAEYEGAEAFVFFHVGDTGIGIAAEDQEAIFQEFKQIDIRCRGRSKVRSGPSAVAASRLLGGNVGVQRQPGIGSTFSVSIPVVYRKVNSEPFRSHPRFCRIRARHDAAGGRSLRDPADLREISALFALADRFGALRARS